MSLTRILQVIPLLSSSWGGTARVVADISRELARRGHEVKIYTSDLSDVQKFEKINGPLQEIGMGDLSIHRFRTINRNNARYWKFFVSCGIDNFLNQKISDYDIVHLHDYRTFQNIVVHHYAQKFEIPYVVQAHGTMNRVNRLTFKWIYDCFSGFRLLNDASEVIALAKAEVDEYAQMGVPDEKTVIIPNGLDFSQYNDLPQRGSFREKFLIDDNENIILFLGRMNREKGIDFLLNSFAHLSRYKADKLRLIMAGPDDGYLKSARKIADSLGISNKVSFLGFLSEREKMSALIDSSVVVYLNPFEPFGIVPLEAALSYTPVIVCKGTPMADIVKKGSFGLSVEYNDVVGLSNLFALFATDAEDIKKMGELGREYVMSNFSLENAVNKLEETYISMIKQRSDSCR